MACFDEHDNEVAPVRVYTVYEPGARAHLGTVKILAHFPTVP